MAIRLAIQSLSEYHHSTDRGLGVGWRRPPRPGGGALYQLPGEVGRWGFAPVSSEQATPVEFHFSAKRVRAGERGGALAVSAYITGRSSIDGLRINNPHRREDIAFSGLSLPWLSHLKSGAELWQAADLAERKKDGTYRMNGGHAPILASHADLALPWGITEAQARSVVDRICAHLVRAHGVGVEYAVHRKAGRIDHAHFLWTTRIVTEAGLGKKARTLNAVAQRREGNTEPSAMENLRALASKAIRDSTDTDWDYRSFKRRGIDRTPEPKLDRRKLREQRRLNAKVGDSRPTDIEKDLYNLRVEKMRAHTSPAQDLVLATLAETVEKLASNQERTNQLIERMLQAGGPKKIEKSPKKPVRVDPPDLETRPVVAMDPRQLRMAERQSLSTAIYAFENRDLPLMEAGVQMFQLLRNITKAYAMWMMNCYRNFLKEGGIELSEFERPYTKLPAWKLRMEEIKRERKLDGDDGDDGPMQVPASLNSARGLKQEIELEL